MNPGWTIAILLALVAVMAAVIALLVEQKRGLEHALRIERAKTRHAATWVVVNTPVAEVYQFPRGGAL